MLGIADNSTLENFERAEKTNPSPRKVIGDRVIHSSWQLPKTKQHGRPILCDFGQARFALESCAGDIQPHVYRAPEVVLRMSWDQKVDIWNVGVLKWDLFYARDSSKQNSDAHHLAEMIAVLGPPPAKMLQSSSYSTKFFNSQGQWKEAVPIPSTTLEDLEENLKGAQQELFLIFLRKMLRWRPEDRNLAKDLLSDPWLRSL